MALIGDSYIENPSFIPSDPAEREKYFRLILSDVRDGTVRKIHDKSLGYKYPKRKAAGLSSLYCYAISLAFADFDDRGSYIGNGVVFDPVVFDSDVEFYRGIYKNVLNYEPYSLKYDVDNAIESKSHKRLDDAIERTYGIINDLMESYGARREAKKDLQINLQVDQKPNRQEFSDSRQF